MQPTLDERLYHSTLPLSPIQSLVIAATSRCVTCVALQPFTVLKTRFEVELACVTVICGWILSFLLDRVAGLDILGWCMQ
jgi:hypothetical protein